MRSQMPSAQPRSVACRGGCASKDCRSCAAAGDAASERIRQRQASRAALSPLPAGSRRSRCARAAGTGTTGSERRGAVAAGAGPRPTPLRRTIVVMPVDDTWKIARIELIEERRVQTDAPSSHLRFTCYVTQLGSASSRNLDRPLIVTVTIARLPRHGVMTRLPMWAMSGSG